MRRLRIRNNEYPLNLFKKLNIEMQQKANGDRERKRIITQDIFEDYTLASLSRFFYYLAFVKCTYNLQVKFMQSVKNASADMHFIVNRIFFTAH